jgi:hypothetical protein
MSLSTIGSSGATSRTCGIETASRLGVANQVHDR